MGRLEVGSPLDTISLGREIYVAAPLLACLLISFFVCLFETECLYIVLAPLELSMRTRLSLNSVIQLLPLSPQG